MLERPLESCRREGQFCKHCRLGTIFTASCGEDEYQFWFTVHKARNGFMMVAFLGLNHGSILDAPSVIYLFKFGRLLAVTK